MKIFEQINLKLTGWFIKDFEKINNKKVRIKYGLLAGWISVVAILLLFIIKILLGLLADSISVVANAFHLLAHLANSIILVVSFKVTARPATAKTPFGHGRMEHVAPLIMSIFLFVSGLQIIESSIHQALEPHKIHYWPALPWIILATIVVKQWLSQFVRFLGKRVNSKTILVNAFHHNIEAVMSLVVIGGLLAGNYFDLPEVDGYIGILLSAWLLYLGYTHGKEAIVPLLGQAPSKDTIQKIREKAKSIDGVEDVHEIIVHDYGSMYLISLHVEIPEKLGPAEMHEIAERCEGALRKMFGGEVVCHTDPLKEKTPEIKAVEDLFIKIIKYFSQIIDYHDFRVISESRERIIIAADIDVKEDIPESEFKQISKDLESEVSKKIPNIAYCVFYITPKFAY
ncbi:MAG: cation transporter [Candidatus Aminicenantes bacterium]|nr:cation transporter [Candidatus Aminicenantes bacterium]